VLFYFTQIDEINDEVDDALEAGAEVIVKRVLAGRELPVPADEGNNGYFLHEVSPQYAAAQHHERYSDEEIFIPERDDKEPARVLRKVFRDGAGQWRELTVMTPTIEKDDLRESILRWMVCLYLFLLLMILLVTVIVLLPHDAAALRPAAVARRLHRGGAECAAGRRDLRHGVPETQRCRAPLCRAGRVVVRAAETVHRQRLS